MQAHILFRVFGSDAQRSNSLPKRSRCWLARRPDMIGSSDAPCQAKGTRSSTVCSLTVNPCVLERAHEGEKGILSGEDVGIAQPADEATVFDP